MANEDVTKLPLEERLVHKVWKARVSGYEDLVKLFRRIDDEGSNEFNKYLGMMKKFVIDNNAVAQEKGLDAVLAFLESAAPSVSGRVAGDVIAGVVLKCLNARPKTREKGMEIILTYVEIEKQDIVQEEVLKGFENKQPKVVAACIEALRRAISDFGGKIFPLKPIVKVLPKLFDHSDKTVREEAKLLAIEIYKWIRDVIRSQLQNIKPVQLKELEEEWSKIPPGAPAPTRLTRTQQKKLEEQQAQGIVAPTGEEVATDGAAEALPVAEEIDPYELIDAVEVLSKLPKDFQENLEAKKWQLRKEALEALEKLVSNPKLEAGHYGELMGSLKKIILKDANVMVVALAAKCVGFLAIGLRKKFTQYAGLIIPALLEKFKEKKVTVVAALRDAVDACLQTTNLAAIQEDVLSSLDSKNPSVKEETIKFLVRAFTKSTPAVLPKSLLKPLCTNLLKRMDESFGPVRDAAAEAFGTLLKVVGEKPVAPFMDQLDKIKQDKVREFSEKAVITAVLGKGTAPPPAAAAAAAAATPASKPATARPPAKKAASSAAAKPSGGPPKSASGGSKGAPKKKAGGSKAGAGKANQAAAQEEVKEPEMSDEEFEAAAAELLPAEVLTQLAHANWKERLTGVESLTKLVGEMEPNKMKAQVLIRVLAKKPGWKDTNFQVLKGKFALCGTIAQMAKPFSKRSAFYALGGLVDKIGDIKLKDQSKETLTTFAEILSLNYVSQKIAKHAGEQKNPKCLAEAINWLSTAIKDFGFKIDLKSHISYVKDALTHTNPAVRAAAISLLGTLHMYVGPTIRVFFEDEKPSLLQQIDAEFQKVKDEKPPTPTRGLSPQGGGEEESGDTADGGGSSRGEEDAVAVNLADLVPRNDISEQIKPEIITQLGDKNWKVRGEALQKIIDILGAAKFITPDLGDLPSALKARLGDSNKNLVTITLNICTTIATAMGPPVNRHLRILGPAMFSTLADAKAGVRAAGIAALNAWHKEIGMALFVDADILLGALSTENPMLRTEVLGWLEEKLPDEKGLPPGLVSIVTPLYSCLEDRSGDVRKKAQAVVPIIMKHVGWDAMSKQANKLKPASKSNVLSIIEKHRGDAPSKPGPAKNAPSKPAAESAAPAASTGTVTKKKAASSAKPAQTKSSKKASLDAEEGPPLLRYAGKDGRVKDERDLKTLKWQFKTPRPELIEQLKEQMAKNISKSLIANMFHKDFKFHIVALNTLTQCVTPAGDGEPPYKTEAIQSLDLLLKWTTLRFYDTNTTVLIKTLEFLQALFVLLNHEDYQMLELEASSFIPHLVLKVGDPKDVVRKMIRNLFASLKKVYPASKLFSYVAEGIKEKNSKTRTECLEELGLLIKTFGMNVCQPSPGKALSAIATNISDRDNGVRSAALNAICEAYVLVGDSVYKLCGTIPDKDRELLEERIKRTSKTRPAAAPEPAATSRAPSTSVPGGDKKTAKVQPPTRPAAAPVKKHDNVRREFALDLDEIESDDANGDVEGLPNLVPHDGYEEVVSEPLGQPQARTGGSPHLGVFSRTNAGTALNFVISEIAGSDMTASMQAIAQLEVVIRNKTKGQVVKHVDQFINAAKLQLNIILTTHLPNCGTDEEPVIKLINCLTNALLTLFTSPLALHVSRDPLKELTRTILTFLLNERLGQLAEGPQIIRTINVLMVKVLEKTDPTVAFGVLIRLLQESVKGDTSGSAFSSPKFVDLIMKCLWKMIRRLPNVITDLKLDQILLDVHTFLKVHPHQVWKSRADDTPLRTIKTVLHSLAKLKKEEILECTSLIVDKNNSEVVAYLEKVLRRRAANTGNQAEQNGREGPGQVPRLQSPTPDLLLGVEGTPRKTSMTKINDRLAEIFKKIGSKENTREGLKELFEIKQKYPEADINPFLKKTSQYFQSYIERGLRNIEMERKGSSLSESSQSSDLTDSSKSLPADDPDINAATLRNRLHTLRQTCGLDNAGNTEANTGHAASGSLHRQNSAEESFPLSAENKMPSYMDIPSVVSQVPDSKGSDMGDLKDIKKRLDRLKARSGT